MADGVDSEEQQLRQRLEELARLEERREAKSATPKVTEKWNVAIEVGPDGTDTCPYYSEGLCFNPSFPNGDYPRCEEGNCPAKTSATRPLVVNEGEWEGIQYVLGAVVEKCVDNNGIDAAVMMRFGNAILLNLGLHLPKGE